MWSNPIMTVCATMESSGLTKSADITLTSAPESNRKVHGKPLIFPFNTPLNFLGAPSLTLRQSGSVSVQPSSETSLTI